MNRIKKRGMGDRSFQPGKGSAERGSEWRKFYDGIAWPDGGKRIESDGFTRSGARLVKRYGQSEPVKDDTSAAVVIH